MPENRQVQSNGVSASSNGQADNLEESMRQLKIQTQDNQDVVVAQAGPYPDRPGEPDCIYYLRTGLCGYGSRCRFNHPTYLQASYYRGELPERVGQPDCQYFLKTGTCRFGAYCKYNHPRDRQDAGQVSLNILGLPMRQEEKSCPYYMRNGTCKFGGACKFNHPQPLSAVVPGTGPLAYGSTSSSVAPPSGLPYVGGLPAWSLPRGLYMSGVRMQGPQAYMPLVVSSSQGIVAPQGWNTYTGTMNPVSSSNVFGSNPVYNPKSQGGLGSNRQVHLLPTPVPEYPERPDQPECQFYMKTGSCKFGPTCKYHHPKERIASSAPGAVGPYGLPLRPGQVVCSYYSMHGICKFGTTCKFDHPMAGYYSYDVNLPALSIPDPSPKLPERNSRIAHSSETSSKSSKSPDQYVVPETGSTIQQNQNTKAPEDISSTSGSTPHLEPSQDQSD